MDKGSEGFGGSIKGQSMKWGGTGVESSWSEEGGILGLEGGSGQRQGQQELEKRLRAGGVPQGLWPTQGGEQAAEKT